MDITNEIEIFKVYEKLPIWQAACLLIGIEPSKLEVMEDGYNGFDGFRFIDDSIQKEYFARFEAVKGALNSSIQHQSNDFTEIPLIELYNWTRAKGFKCAFFDGDNTADYMPYLDPNHPHYSQKLAASVLAWLEFEEGDLTGKSAKQHVTDWLEINYEKLGLIYQGSKNNEAIKEIAKVVNWDTGGGASKTPVSTEVVKNKVNSQTGFSPNPYKIKTQPQFEPRPLASYEQDFDDEEPPF